MTIQAIAKKQLGDPTRIYFARKGSGDCMWFEAGVLMQFCDTGNHSRRATLHIEDFAATDWKIITRGAV